MTGLYSLSRKEGWRRWADAPARLRPEPLTVRQLSRLGTASRQDYDEARHDWHANFGILKTPQLAAIHDELEQIVAANRQDPDQVRGAAVIDALPGLGKTTIANVFARGYDRAQRRRLGQLTEEGHERLPVFRVGLTSRTTLRTLNRMICEFYGHPGTGRASAAQLATFAVDCVLSCHTRVGIVDDLHFVDMNRRDGVDVSNHLKWLANELPVTFIYAGVGLAERRLFAEGLAGDTAVLAQTARRWTRLELPPFEVTTDIGRRHWMSLLKATERQLVLAAAHPGMLSGIADYLFARCGGHIGSFITLVIRGCWKAIRHGGERLTVDLMDTVRIDEASEGCPRRPACRVRHRQADHPSPQPCRHSGSTRRRHSGVSGPARHLPLRVVIGDGEALDSWLLRLAHRNQVPAQWLLPVLGLDRLPAPWRNHALIWRLPAGMLRRVEAQAGLRPHTLDQAVLDRFDPLGWRPTVGSRYCVTCLADSGGQWPIRWRLPQVVACTRHRCLLAVVCPVCTRTPHSGWSQQSGLLPPHWCSIREKRGDVCGADLLTHPVHRLAADDPRLAAQEWINQRLDAMNPCALAELRDLDTVSTWFRLRTEPAALRHLGHCTVDAVAEYRRPPQVNPLRRHRPTAAIVAAAFATQAIGLLTAADHPTRYRRFVPLFRSAEHHTAPGPPPAPIVLSHKRITRLSATLQHQLLIACDPHLAASERLRYRTCTSSPCLPDPGSATAAGRARHIPEYLWPDWIIRFRPPRGAYTDSIATDIPAALLIPGNPLRNTPATAELGRWTHNTSQTLRLLVEHHRDALTAICALARFLDTHGAPIDYRRRRANFTDVALSRRHWHELCYRADADPGKGPRQRNARRYLFQLLTGADLANPTCRLAFASNQD